MGVGTGWGWGAFGLGGVAGSWGALLDFIVCGGPACVTVLL